MHRGKAKIGNFKSLSKSVRSNAIAQASSSNGSGVTLQGLGLNQESEAVTAKDEHIQQQMQSLPEPSKNAVIESQKAGLDTVKEGRNDAILSSREEAIQIAATTAARKNAFKFGSIAASGNPPAPKKRKTSYKNSFLVVDSSEDV